MNIIKNWTICVCVTLVVASLLTLLTPKGNMGKFYKTVISLFIFMSFIIPLKDARIVNLNDFGTRYISFEDSTNNAISKFIKLKIEEVLKNNGVENSSVIVSSNQVDNEIEITNVSIAITNEYDKKHIQDLIYEELGINAEVHKIGD